MGNWPESYNYIPGDAISLDWDALKQMFQDSDGSNQCLLVAVDWRSVSVLVSCLRFAEYWHLWGLPGEPAHWTPVDRQRWKEIAAFVAELENCLMSGCNVQDMITTNRMIVAALIGQNVDLTTAIPTTVDFTENGISPRLLAISEAVGGGESIEDDLQNIKTAIEAIAIVAAG